MAKHTRLGDKHYWEDKLLSPSQKKKTIIIDEDDTLEFLPHRGY